MKQSWIADSRYSTSTHKYSGFAFDSSVSPSFFALAVTSFSNWSYRRSNMRMDYESVFVRKGCSKDNDTCDVALYVSGFVEEVDIDIVDSVIRSKLLIEL